MNELFVSETWRGRWVVARKPWVEHENDPSIVASFGDEDHARRWLETQQKWLNKLHGVTN